MVAGALRGDRAEGPSEMVWRVESTREIRGDSSGKVIGREVVFKPWAKTPERTWSAWMSYTDPERVVTVSDLQALSRGPNRDVEGDTTLEIVCMPMALGMALTGGPVLIPAVDALHALRDIAGALQSAIDAGRTWGDSPEGDDAFCDAVCSHCGQDCEGCALDARLSAMDDAEAADDDDTPVQDGQCICGATYVRGLEFVCHACGLAFPVDDQEDADGKGDTDE